VSPGAPFRHFRDRDALLAAVAATASTQLLVRFRATIGDAESPADQLAATAGDYVRFAADSPAGFDVIYASGLDRREHPDLRQSQRALIDLLLPLGVGLTHNHQKAIDLLEAHIASSHGFAALMRAGFFAARPTTADDIATRAIHASRTLIAGFQ
jgi:AcrR family transcriptional regulator